MTAAQPFPHYTCAGKEVWFLEPERTLLDLDEDFAPTLGRLFRYGAALGDVTDLMHLALCVELADLHYLNASNLLRIRGFAGGHDLHEAIVLDVPAPLKPMLSEYGPIENRWARHTHARVGLGSLPTGRMAGIVRHLDGRAAVIEMTEMRHPNVQTQIELSGGRPSADERTCYARVRAMSDADRWQIIRDVIVAAREAA